MYIYIHDIKAWQETFKTKLSLDYDLEPMPWGNTDMLVTDPFRNALRFCQEGTHEGENTPNK